MNGYILVLALVGGLISAVFFNGSQDQLDDRGPVRNLPGALARALTDQQAEARGWFAAHPGFSGQIPDSEMTDRGRPFHSFVGSDGRIASWIEGDPISLESGRIAAALATLTSGDIGSGVSDAGLVQSASGKVLPLPAGLALPDGRPVLTSLPTTPGVSPGSDPGDLALLPVVDIIGCGGLGAAGGVFSAEEGARRFGNDCWDLGGSEETRMLPCPAAQPGFRVERRSVSYDRDNGRSFGPWVADGNYCGGVIVSPIDIPPIDLPEDPYEEVVYTEIIDCETRSDHVYLEGNFQREVTGYRIASTGTTVGLNMGPWQGTCRYRQRRNTSCLAPAGTNRGGPRFNLAPYSWPGMKSLIPPGFIAPGGRPGEEPNEPGYIYMMSRQSIAELAELGITEREGLPGEVREVSYDVEGDVTEATSWELEDPLLLPHEARAMAEQSCGCPARTRAEWNPLYAFSDAPYCWDEPGGGLD